MKSIIEQKFYCSQSTVYPAHPCFSQCDYCKRKESHESTPAPEILDFKAEVDTVDEVFAVFENSKFSCFDDFLREEGYELIKTRDVHKVISLLRREQADLSYMLGKKYGYPDCCIMDFFRDIINGYDPRARNVDGSGFIPCRAHYNQITSGELSISDLRNQQQKAPAPEITEDWIREKITKSYNPAKAIHSAIAEKMAELKAQKDQLGRWYSDRLNEKSSETELRNQLAAKEKEVTELKELLKVKPKHVGRHTTKD